MISKSFCEDLLNIMVARNEWMPILLLIKRNHDWNALMLVSRKSSRFTLSEFNLFMQTYKMVKKMVRQPMNSPVLEIENLIFENKILIEEVNDCDDVLELCELLADFVVTSGECKANNQDGIANFVTAWFYKAIKKQTKMPNVFKILENGIYSCKKAILFKDYFSEEKLHKYGYDKLAFKLGLIDDLPAGQESLLIIKNIDIYADVWGYNKAKVLAKRVSTLELRKYLYGIPQNATLSYFENTSKNFSIYLYSDENLNILKKHKYYKLLTSLDNRFL